VTIPVAFTLIHWFGVMRMMILLLALVPLAYYVVSSIVAWRFFRRERARRLPNFMPSVSLLKPVRGVDFASYENFASFCTQDYPDYEILFAVNDEADPAAPLVRRLIADFPEQKIRLLVGAEHLGANRKVNKLARLAREAKHEILVLTDGDVRVGPQYLREMVAPFADKKIGAVTSFYRGVAEQNLAAELEAVGAATDFFPGVLMADWMEGVTFALGASIATTKSWVQKIGGFGAIADLHSDDYELGNRIAKAGGKILLSREPVWTMYPGQTLQSFWDHQLRWARTVRCCRPVSYLGLIFTLGLPWSVVATLLARNWQTGGALLLAYFVLRLTQAWLVGVWGVGDQVVRRRIWLVPVYDAIHFFVWLASFASNRIVWGGEQFVMQKGQLVPLNPLDPSDARVSPEVRH
jgi:ceramide glucosyltransferase